MAQPKKTPTERRADVLDVHVLDVLAQVEVLLRNVREIQRHALQLRGVNVRGLQLTGPQAQAEIEKRLLEMQGDCDGLRSALADAVEMLREEAAPAASE